MFYWNTFAIILHVLLCDTMRLITCDSDEKQGPHVVISGYVGCIRIPTIFADIVLRYALYRWYTHITYTRTQRNYFMV